MVRKILHMIRPFISEKKYDVIFMRKIIRKNELTLRTILIVSLTLFFIIITISPLFSGEMGYDIYIKNYSSLILVFLTYIYVLLTYLILNSNNKLAKEQLQPYVIASFSCMDNVVYFLVKNFGKRSAINVSINMSEGLDELQIKAIRGNYKSLLRQKFLAPGQEIKTIVSDPGIIISHRLKNINECFDFKVDFFDSSQTKYSLDYQIDLNNYFDEIGIQNKTINTNLIAIENKLEKQNEILEKILRS